MMGREVFVVVALALSIGTARADDDNWQCKALLCMSNPGGETEFKECKPPIDKMRRELRRGHRIPPCEGAGFKTTQPVYDPYTCKEGLSLIQDESGVVCRSSERTAESNQCNAENPAGFEGRPSTAQYVPEKEGYVCRDYEYSAAEAREKPNYIDFQVEGAGTTRIWF